ISVLKRGVSCGGLASEEMEDFVAFTDPMSRISKYICLFDPLDGSSNIDVNNSIGTIFSIYRRVSPVGQQVARADFLQPGRSQVAAGYIIYGSSTMLVYATKRGVNGFTLDPSIGEFCLSHPAIRCPASAGIWSVNMANFHWFAEPVQKYISAYLEKPVANGIQYAQRYSGTLVADMHRTLLKGGIFLYPATSHNPLGKLRLMYECNPFAFIMEIAGGLATDGQSRLLDVIPETLHGRVPFFAGSRGMMNEMDVHFGGNKQR
ncbi:MAG: class 1 fructose-bisphosphatase, partial [Bacteroidota bacterium]